MKNDRFESVDANGKIKIIHIFDHVVYDLENKKVKIVFSNAMLKNLTNLDTNYTKYRLGNILNFKNLYSISLYELFKKELKGKSCKTITIDMDNLKEWLGVNDKYPRYYDFKNKVLDRVQDEINSQNEIFFTYEEMRNGKKVAAIKFYVKAEQKQKNNLSDADNETVATIDGGTSYVQQVKEIVKESISSIAACSIYKSANGDIELVKAKYEIAKKQGNIKNIVAWMISVIENDYNPPKGKEKPNSFRDYSGQREVDIEELEKEFLGRE